MMTGNDMMAEKKNIMYAKIPLMLLFVLAVGVIPLHASDTLKVLLLTNKNSGYTVIIPPGKNVQMRFAGNFKKYAGYLSEVTDSTLVVSGNVVKMSELEMIGPYHSSKRSKAEPYVLGAITAASLAYLGFFYNSMVVHGNYTEAELLGELFPYVVYALVGPFVYVYHAWTDTQYDVKYSYHLSACMAVQEGKKKYRSIP